MVSYEDILKNYLSHTDGAVENFFLMFFAWLGLLEAKKDETWAKTQALAIKC